MTDTSQLDAGYGWTLGSPMALGNGKIDQIITALIKAKLAFGKVVKDKNNPAFKTKYADLGAVLEAVEPALLENGLIIVQPTTISDGQHVSLTYLLHVSGQYLFSEYPLVPTKYDPQGFGSALTYARRYQVLSLLGLAPEDDDGNVASQRQARQAAPARNFEAELEKCTTVQQVMDLGRAAGAVGEWDRLQAKFVAKRDELQKAEAEAAEAKANQAAAGEPGPEAGAVSGSP